MVEHIGNTKCKNSDLKAEAFHLLKILFESLMDYNRATMLLLTYTIHDVHTIRLIPFINISNVTVVTVFHLPQMI